MDKFIFSDVLNANLTEAEVEPEIKKKKQDDEKDSEKIKDQDDRKEKDISDLDKDDMDDEEARPDEEDVAVSITMNDNVDKGGQIRFVNFTKLATLTSIEACLKLFKIDPDNVDKAFDDMLQLTFRSPIKDFSEEEYEVKLMDMLGEITVHRPDYNTTITKKSVDITPPEEPTTDLNQTVQNNVAGQQENPEAGENNENPPEEQPPVKNTEEGGINLDYLNELDDVFRKVVYNEFFNRILRTQAG